MIGDLVTGGMNNILYATYDGNMELLKTSIKNSELDDFIRAAMLDALSFLYLDGVLSREDFQNFLKELVYSHQVLGDYIYTAVQSVILDCHFREMLPEIRFMYDRDMLDTSVHGGYDSSVDYIYRFDDRISLKPEPVRVDSLRHWMMFEGSDSGNELSDENVIDEMFKNIDRDFSETDTVRKVKIGRNDPCPCGSGKKYKFCCMNKKTAGVAGQVETEAQCRYWLKLYPETGVTKQEWRIYLDDFYDAESIAIDQLIYLALHHRAIPIWRREEQSVVDKRRRWYLGQALDKFTEKMAAEGFDSLSEYDARCSIHYLCREWMTAYLGLLGSNKSDPHYCLLKKYLDAKV